MRDGIGIVLGSIIGSVGALVAAWLLFQPVRPRVIFAQAKQTVYVPVRFEGETILDHDQLFVCGYLKAQNVFACVTPEELTSEASSIEKLNPHSREL